MGYFERAVEKSSCNRCTVDGNKIKTTWRITVKNRTFEDKKDGDLLRLLAVGRKRVNTLNWASRKLYECALNQTTQTSTSCGVTEYRACRRRVNVLVQRGCITWLNNKENKRVEGFPSSIRRCNYRTLRPGPVHAPEEPHKENSQHQLKSRKNRLRSSRSTVKFPDQAGTGNGRGHAPLKVEETVPTGERSTRALGRSTTSCRVEAVSKFRGERVKNVGSRRLRRRLRFPSLIH